MGDGKPARLQRGLALRREVLGASYVDTALAAMTDFTRPIQEYVTETCWGDVWTRPGLDRRTRSLVNLGMLTALNRMTEFGVHVRGARRNGCTEDEIQEVLLQTAAYCGAPAALEAFRIAAKVLDEFRAETAAAHDGAAHHGVAHDGVAPDGAASDGAAPDGAAPDGAGVASPVS
ncbi:MAG: carboxymuconolactone decarboxylase family protein [Streptosporangiaceae bacterium]